MIGVVMTVRRTFGVANAQDISPSTLGAAQGHCINRYILRQRCAANRGYICAQNSEILIIFFVYLAGVTNVDVCGCGVIPHRLAPGSEFCTHPGGILITQGVY